MYVKHFSGPIADCMKDYVKTTSNQRLCQNKDYVKIHLEIHNSASLEILKKHLSNLIKPNSNNIFNINNPLRLKLLTHLRIGFSHLKEHKFKHNFQDSIDPLCSWGKDIESTVHFFSIAQILQLRDRPFWTN